MKGQFLQSVLLYYYIEVLSFRNKLRKERLIRLILYFLVLAAGLFLLLKTISRRAVMLPDAVEMSDFVWPVVAYILLRLLLSRKFGLRREETNFVELADSTLNPVIGYRYMSTVTGLFFPLLIATSAGFILLDWMVAVTAFVGLFFFFNTINGAAFFFKVSKLMLKPAINRTLNIALGLGAMTSVAFWAGGMHSAGGVLKFLTTPLSKVVSVLAYGDTIVIGHYLPPLLFYAIVYLLVGVLFYRWLSRNEYRFTLEPHEPIGKSLHEESRQPVDQSMGEKSHANAGCNASRRTGLPISRMLTPVRGEIVQILLPSIIYVMIAITTFHSTFVKREAADSIAFVLAEWFALLGFPLIYIVPSFKADLKYLEAYRYSNRATSLFLAGCFIKYYYRFILSLSIATAVICLWLWVGYGTGYFGLVGTWRLLLFTFVMPISFTLIGLFVTLKLPDVYFSTNKTLPIIPMIVMIWILALLMMPMLAVGFVGYEFISVIWFILSTMVFLIASKRTISKMEV